MANPLISLLTLFTLFVPGESLCYLPNGIYDAANKWAAPCSTDPRNPLHTICCQLGWENPPGGDLKNGSTKEECLPNGLCQNRAFTTERGNYTEYYRQTCTSSDWKTGACLDVCSTGGREGVAVQMTPCDDTNSSEKWCCGNNKDCCDKSGVITIPKLFVGLANVTSSSSSMMAAATATTTITISSSLPTQSLSSPTSSPAAAIPHNGKLNTGAKVGIAVGSIIVAISFSGLGIFLVRKRRAGKHVPTQEMEARNPPVELPNDGKREELDTTVDATFELQGHSSSESMAERED